MIHKIGIHLSYWQESWSDSLIPILAQAKQAGFDVAEFPLLDPARMDFPKLKDALDQSGLLASCGTGLSQATDITSPDPEIRQAGLAHLHACLQGAAALGSPVLGGVTYAPWGFFPSDDRTTRRRHCIRSLREIALYAQDLGVTLCLEILNRFEGYLLNTVEQGLALLTEVDHPNLKLHLDTFHMNIEEDCISDAIRLASEKLGHLHCVANNRKAPGQGHINWAEIQTALKDINYQGFLVAETFVNPAGEVGQGLFIWRPLAGDLQENAAKTARFLRSEVAFEL